KLYFLSLAQFQSSGNVKVESLCPQNLLLSEKIASVSILTCFEAFHPDGTPYSKVNFHPKVKTACSENRTGRVGLKITKAVLVGDVAVGKTCLVNRFCHDVFDRDYKATIGVDFEVEKFSVLSIPITLQIWDTAGQERFKCIAASYYRGAQIVIVAFDLTNEESLHHTDQWMEEACASADQPVKFLLGTKKDLLVSFCGVFCSSTNTETS
uniref:Uncharacterized protein n=1 Tax=Biomphalaria glabrata TaxID=6526 RepID=A0A2C9M4S3_BIOGL